LSILALVSILIVSIQVIYLILFLVGLRKASKESFQAPHAVSVIVCAHDEEQNLRELIPLLLAQDHPEFEIIIVEDRCNDGTYDYLKQMIEENTRIKMVQVAQKPDHISGKKFGLTLGIKAARYDWLLFTDADCRPAGDQWVRQMTTHYSTNTQIVLGFSPYEKRKGWLNSFIRFESLLTGIQMISLAKLGRPYMGLGRNLSYAKSLFFQNKGFNSHLEIVGGDDDLFVNRQATRHNTVVSVGPQAITISIPKLNWRDFLHQKLRHLSVGKRYKFSDKVMLAVFSSTWLLTWFYVVPTIFLNDAVFISVSIILIRWILLIILFQTGSRKLGGTFEPWKLPFLDFIFSFYYLVTGLRALFVKRIRWKN
jgi:glycosyltransferase involved in cell wall biosynthesis